jgi:hypothetical protein
VNIIAPIPNPTEDGPNVIVANVSHDRIKHIISRVQHYNDIDGLAFDVNAEAYKVDTSMSWGQHQVVALTVQSGAWMVTTADVDKGVILQEFQAYSNAIVVEEKWGIHRFYLRSGNPHTGDTYTSVVIPLEILEQVYIQTKEEPNA